MRTWVCLVAIASVIEASVPSWPHTYWDIPGDYCRAKYPSRQCCQGRQDPCNVPILGTLCYCDTFCNRTENADCCPDYFEHCEGLSNYQPLVQKPEEIVRPEEVSCKDGVQHGDGSGCFSEGRFYSVRDVVVKNCNKCRCQLSPSNAQCMEFLCETNPCLLDDKNLDEIRQGFHQGQYSWHGANYSDLWGKSLEEGLSRKLGTFQPKSPVSDRVVHMTAIKFHYTVSEIPSRFDSREEWVGKIGEIADQGWCSASWAFSTVAVASDRFSIDSIGLTTRPLSPQVLLSCNTRGQSGCKGGHVDRAWNYLRKYGSIPEDCYPYLSSDGTGDHGTCKLPRSTQVDVRKLNCPAMMGRRELFKTQPAYRVGRPNTARHPRRREMDIMYEIMKHGPVQAIMEVYSDFFSYKSGVYHKTNLAVPGKSGFHSVKIIGWGSEDNRPYWLAANSWGKDWGLDGYFKILRGSNECKIEEFVVGVWAKTQRRDQQARNRRRRLTFEDHERRRTGRHGQVG